MAFLIEVHPDTQSGTLVFRYSGFAHAIRRARRLARPRPGPLLGCDRDCQQRQLAIGCERGTAPVDGEQPSHPNDAAILITLQPGVYTVMLYGANGTTG